MQVTKHSHLGSTVTFMSLLSQAPRNAAYIHHYFKVTTLIRSIMKSCYYIFGEITIMI